MANLLNLLSSYPFLLHAVLAAILAGVAGGLAGTFVVVKRVSFVSGGIAHAVLGGVGLAMWLGFNPLAGAFIFALVAALILGISRLKAGQSEDITIATLWSMGMAAGIVFAYLTPGYNADLLSYLFGNILLVTAGQLWMLAAVCLLLGTAAFVFWRQLVFVSFDEHYARLRGIKADLLYLGLLVAIALTIVVLIQVVGILMVISLLTLPAAIAALFTRTLPKMLLLAIVGAAVLNLAGLGLSYQANLPPGAVIILLSGTVYFVGLMLKRFTR